MTLIVMFINILKTMEIKNAAHCPINDKDLCLDELVRDLFNDEQYTWNKDNTEMKRVVNSIIQLIDSFPNRSILIAATNQIQMIDEALVRRFELQLEFTAPKAAVLDAYYDSLLQKYPPQFQKMERLYDITFAEAKNHLLQSVKNNVIQDAIANHPQDLSE